MKRNILENLEKCINKMRKLKVKIDKQQLKEYYLNQGLSCKEIAIKLGISKSWVNQMLKSLGIIRDSGEARKLYSKNNIPFDREIVSSMYYKDGLNMTDIAIKLNVSKGKLWRYSGIISREKIHKDMLSKVINENEDNILKWYIEDNLSPKEIALKLDGISKDSIIRYLNRNKIRRNRSQSAKINVLKNENFLEIARKSNIPWNKGIPMKIESKNKLRAVKLGKPSLLKGIKFSEEHRENMSIAMKGKIPWNKGLSNYLSKDSLEKMSLAQMIRWDRDRNIIIKNIRKNTNKKMTLPECAMSILLNYYYPNKYIYVGNGEAKVSGKKPDFINVEEHKIIEVFGRYWHSHDKTGEDFEFHKLNRINIFKKSGYDTLVIWDNELINKLEVIKNTLNKIILFQGYYPTKKELIPINNIPRIREREDRFVY